MILSQTEAKASVPAMSNALRLWRGFLSLARNPSGLTGLIIVALFVVMAIFGEVLAPFPYTEQHYSDALMSPSKTYLFGTDQYGRDIFSRVLVGARSILLLSVTATLLGLLLGVTVGLITGYFGGWVDEILMRLMDVIMSFPSLLLALLLLSVFGSGMFKIIIGIAVVFMPRVARVVRSIVLDLKSKEFVDAAKVRGESAFYIMSQEILPNASGPIIVEGSIRISYAILLAASLGYLGLGVQPPSPDWGLQVSEGRQFILIAPWVVIFPSLAIAILVIGVNLLTDGLKKVMDSDTTGPNQEMQQGGQ
ncbi:MAG: ABC transporter permease [Deinococcales bacterium]